MNTELNNIDGLDNQLVNLYKQFESVKNEQLISPKTRELDVKIKDISTKIQDLRQNIDETQKNLTNNDQTIRISKISEQLSTLSISVDRFRAHIPTSFRATETISKNVATKVIENLGDSVVNAFNKKIRGGCFIGASTNARDKQLPVRIERETQKQGRVTEKLDHQLSKQQELIKQYDNLLKTQPENKSEIKGMESKLRGVEKTIKSLENELGTINTSLDKLQQKLETKVYYDSKGDEMRQNFKALGGERIELITEDNVKLDGLYLDAQAFRVKLSDAGCKLTSFEVQDGSTTRAIQSISMSKTDFEAKGGEVFDALKNLKAFSEGDKPGSGWSYVLDGENVLFVRTEELPKPNQEHPLFAYNNTDKAWEVKTHTYASQTRKDQPLEDKNNPKPSSGTVVLSSGNAGMYEMHKGEALSFLFKNMNVVLFNFRGYGKSEGEPTERGLKLDMEAAYQLAKNKSGHPDNKILFKALCMSGGPAAYVASKHPETNVFLDQTYSQFKTVVANETKNHVDMALSSLGRTDKKNAMSKVGDWLKKGISSLVGNVVSFIAPDFNTAKALAQNKGQKAVFFTHDDDLMDVGHVNRIINTVAKAGQMEHLLVISGPGEHGEAILNIESSQLDYQSRVENNVKVTVFLREIDSILDKLTTRYKSFESDLEVKILQLTKQAQELEDAGGDANVNKAQQIRQEMMDLNMSMDGDLQKLENEINAVKTKRDEWHGKLMGDLSDTEVRQQRTGMNQLSHFLTKANLSDDIIKSNTQLKTSTESVQQRFSKSSTDFKNRLESLGSLYQIYGDMAKGKVTEATRKGSDYFIKMDNGKEYPLTKDQVSTLLSAVNDVDHIRRFASGFEDTHPISDKVELQHGEIAGLSKMLGMEVQKLFEKEKDVNEKSNENLVASIEEATKDLDRYSASMEEVMNDFINSPEDSLSKELSDYKDGLKGYREGFNVLSDALKQLKSRTLDAIESNPNLSPEEKWNQKNLQEKYMSRIGQYIDDRMKEIDIHEENADTALKMEAYLPDLNARFDKIDFALQTFVEDSSLIKDNILKNLERLLTKGNKTDISLKLDDQFANLQEGIKGLQEILGNGPRSLEQKKQELIQNFESDTSIPAENQKAIKIYIENYFAETLESIKTHLTVLQNFDHYSENCRKELTSFSNLWNDTTLQINDSNSKGLDVLKERRTSVTAPKDTAEYQNQLKAYSEKLEKVIEEIIKDGEFHLNNLGQHMDLLMDNPDKFLDEEVFQDISDDVDDFIRRKHVELKNIVNTLEAEQEEVNEELGVVVNAEVK